MNAVLDFFLLDKSQKVIASLAEPLQVPFLVDAAAEGLTVPNPHLSQGADMVAYSGGKYLQGPQSSILLLGRKDLVPASRITVPHITALGVDVKWPGGENGFIGCRRNVDEKGP